MNLNRLKGTELLADGLDSLLATWLKLDRATGVEIDFSDPEWQAVERLPGFAKRYYQVLLHWPQTAELYTAAEDSERSRNWICLPPQVVTGSDQDVVLVRDSRNGAMFTYTQDGIRKDEEGKLVINPDDEFLIGYTLQSLIMRFCNSRSRTLEKQSYDYLKAHLVFSAHCYDEMIRHYYYFPETDELAFTYGGISANGHAASREDVISK